MIDYKEFKKVQDSLTPKGDMKDVLDYFIEKVIIADIYNNLMKNPMITMDFEKDYYRKKYNKVLEDKITIPRNMVQYHKTKEYIINRIKEILKSKGWDACVYYIIIETKENGELVSYKSQIDIKKLEVGFKHKFNKFMTKFFFN